MKKKLKPTLQQRKIIDSNGLNSNEWFVIKNLNDRLVLNNRFIDREKIIWKDGRLS